MFYIPSLFANAGKKKKKKTFNEKNFLLSSENKSLALNIKKECLNNFL